ncbi:MAG: hypothetical protein GWM90_06575, partial [Gemmatimonadetes bacterium]|nr:hypothetical protein [Gemmatimonadota bacterium]NIQ52616.1 hypothetical protein [Gemmatimonadota bacterium]NIU72753.1 hypothetical protein [Gammaproteobacteria bacterium]NIX43785.1 hypothetical protein [Gemmatimonadota bacterium]NIY07987.1 hypothetical protein [Gemmatimonadota bacterium]
RTGAITLIAAGIMAAPLAGQARPAPPPASSIGDTVAVVPAPDYQAGAVHRRLLGDGWRDVWLTPVDAPVFGLDRFAGG